MMISEIMEKELKKVMFWTSVVASESAAMLSETYSRSIIHSLVVTEMS